MKTCLSIIAILTLLLAGTAFGKTVMVYERGMFKYKAVESPASDTVTTSSYVYQHGMFVYVPRVAKTDSGKAAPMVYDRGLFRVVGEAEKLGH